MAYPMVGNFATRFMANVLPVNEYRWSLNPLNPLDIDYDPDADGWYDRTIFDTPAEQGFWDNRRAYP